MMFPDFISTKTLLLFPKSLLILLLFLQPPLFLSHLVEVPFPAGSQVRPPCSEIVIGKALFSLGCWFFRPQLPVPPNKRPRSWDARLKGASGDHLIQHWSWSTARDQLLKDGLIRFSTAVVPINCPSSVPVLLSLDRLKVFPYFIMEISSIVHFLAVSPNTRSKSSCYSSLSNCIYVEGERNLFPHFFFFFWKREFTNSSYLLVSPHGTFSPGFPPRSQHTIKVHWQEKPWH